MKINLTIVTAIGIGVFKIEDNWCLQLPFLIILFEELK